MDIVSVPLVINDATDTMIVKARLPNGTGVDQFLLGAEGKPAFNVLHGLFQGDCRRRSDEEMNVIGHNHKFVEQKAALLAVLLHDVNQEPGHAVRLKDGLSSIGDGSDKKCADFLGIKLHMSGPGLKPKDCK